MRKAWLPNQHGVWAMMIAPALGGSLLAGFRLQHAGLLVAWISAYLCFMAVRGLLQPRRRDAYRAPVVVYGVVCLASTAGLLVWRPALLWWGVPLSVILGASLVFIVTGHERTVVNDALLMGSSCLLTVVAITAAALGPSGVGASGPGAFVRAVAVPGAWAAAAVFAVYFWGTILYVKTMIRERGKPGWYVASVAYHVVGAGLGFIVSPWIGLAALVPLARAALVPKLAPRAKPQVIGVAEFGVTALILVAVCLTIRL